MVQAMVSAVDMAKRALVSVLLRVAALYAVALGVKRDAPDAEVKRAFRKVCKKSHPDRGSNKAHQQELNSAYAVWEWLSEPPRKKLRAESQRSERVLRASPRENPPQVEPSLFEFTL